MPRPLYLQGKSPRYPLDRRLRGPHSRSDHGVEEKNSQPPPGFEPRSPSLITYIVEETIELHILLCRESYNMFLCIYLDIYYEDKGFK
jgi:hypothetical protein